MAPFEPFEERPLIAVAVSGGADSLALTLMADAWARARGGSVLALTVDHGLRPESASDAAQVQEWLETRGIDTQILTLPPFVRQGRLQEQARVLRYEALEEVCRVRGILHLLMGHHREDQRETQLMRAQMNSGPAGLAGMAAIVERPYVRLLRPLLTTPKTFMTDYLEALGQPWITDPSNTNPRFLRTRLRTQMTGVEDAVCDGHARTAQDAALNACVRQVVTLDPRGFAIIDHAWFTLDVCSQRDVMQRVLMTIGSRPYPPSRLALNALCVAVREGRPQTLNACLVRPQKGRLLVYRENAGLPQAQSIDDIVTPSLWDRRWRIRLTPTLTEPFQGGFLAPLGEEGWRQVKADLLESPPHFSALTLPVIWKGNRVAALPFFVKIQNGKGFTALPRWCIQYVPCYPLVRFAFTIA